MSQTLKAIILWNLYTALGRLLVIITANIMALSMYLALFYQLGTITAPILQMRRLRLELGSSVRKDMQSAGGRAGT